MAHAACCIVACWTRFKVAHRLRSSATRPLVARGMRCIMHIASARRRHTDTYAHGSGWRRRRQQRRGSRGRRRRRRPRRKRRKCDPCCTKPVCTKLAVHSRQCAEFRNGVGSIVTVARQPRGRCIRLRLHVASIRSSVVDMHSRTQSCTFHVARCSSGLQVPRCMLQVPCCTFHVACSKLHDACCTSSNACCLLHPARCLYLHAPYILHVACVRRRHAR